MNGPTKIVLLIVLLVMIIFDIWVIWYYGTDQSISRVIFELSRAHPVIAFAVGFVCGHIFWRND